MLKNNRGFSLFFTVFILILIILVSALLANMLTQFLTFGRRQEAASQDYHYAEFGVYYTVWKINNSDPFDPDPYPTKPCPIERLSIHDKNIDYWVIRRDTDGDLSNIEYDIIATVVNDNEQELMRIVAHYLDGSIVSW